MKSDRRLRGGMRPAFFALLGLCAASAVGCTKCTSCGSGTIFSRDAGTSTADAGTDAAANACDSYPDPPDAVPAVAKPCRYWVVNTATCKDIDVPAQPGKSWKASSIFGEISGDKTPKALSTYCKYEWSDATSGPSSTDSEVLPSPKSANCTYVTKQGTPDLFTKWAHNELLPPIAERLPASGTPGTLDVKVRVVVLDTAPSVTTNSLPSGNGLRPSHHGRTLAQLIRESACQNPADCAVEVRTALAMPLVLNTDKIPEVGTDGGYFGLLSDVTSAIWKETNDYRLELEQQITSPEVRRKTPLRVIFNESFGFGNTDAFPNRCSATLLPSPTDDPTARALFDAMTAASCLGILHVAAAGNHTGGDTYLEGMLCPARWDKAIVPADDVCNRLWGDTVWTGDGKTTGLKSIFGSFSRAKTTTKQRPGVESSPISSGPGSTETDAGLTETDALLSVGGVDYHGSPIVLTRPNTTQNTTQNRPNTTQDRPNACPEAVAIGIGGIALEDSQEIGPFLFGTSVSAAVASSRLAVQWADSGNLGRNAKEMQLFSAAPVISFKREAALCGTARIDCPKDIPWIGKPATTIEGQNDGFPDEPYNVLWQPPARTRVTTMDTPVCPEKLPHCRRPSRSMTADVWPQPIDPVCLKCAISMSIETRDPELWIVPNLDPIIVGDVILIVDDASGAIRLMRTIPHSAFDSRSAQSSRIVLAGADQNVFKNARVWLSGYDSAGTSYSQQIFVDK